MHENGRLRRGGQQSARRGHREVRWGLQPAAFVVGARGRVPDNQRLVLLVRVVERDVADDAVAQVLRG